MIKLDNVSKTYISKTKQEVHALNGVSFELGSSGMVFILGKSGSGKSTLLNLLGGLDKPSQGDVTVDGVSMKDFSPMDYEAYRNGYVGFIFKEYNLLEDFNVKDNVALALQLSKGENIDEKVADALQQVELNDEYLTRHVNELSGGEKQRIAIARAIVKDSKLILADEPTGNLDSMTGESVWNILKKLSRTKLVVVVSHDRDSAEQYADRIIELADGNVVSDNGAQPADGDGNAQLNTTKKGLSFKVCMKLTFNNLKQRKIRSASVTVMSILCILALLVVQLCLTFSSERVMSRIIEDNDVPYFVVAQGSQSGEVKIDSLDDLKDFFLKMQHSGKLRTDTVDYIDGNANYIVDGIVKSKQQVLDCGLSFVGEALELDEFSFYTTKQNLDILLKQQRIEYLTTDEEGREIHSILTQEQSNIDFVLGKKVSLGNFFSASLHSYQYATLAGVIDTDSISPASRQYIPNILARRDFAYWGKNHEIVIGSSSVVTLGDFRIIIGLNMSAINDGISDTVLMLDSNSKNGELVFKPKNELTLADDEIVITPMLIKYILDIEHFDIKDYVDLETGAIKKIPEMIGEKIPIRLYNKKTNELEADLGEFKVVGVCVSNATSFNVICSNAKLTELYLQFSEDIPILVQTESVKNINEFLTTLRNDYDGYVSGTGMLDCKLYLGSDDVGPIEVANGIYSFEKSLVLTTIFVGAVGLLMLIVLILLVINLISFSILDRKKEIGVLTALGTANRDLTKIFVLETILISAVTLVVSLAGAIGITYFISSDHFSIYVNYIPLLQVDVLTVAVAIVTSFGFPLLATLIPLRKIGKLNPVDAIRDN